MSGLNFTEILLRRGIHQMKWTAVICKKGTRMEYARDKSFGICFTVFMGAVSSVKSNIRKELINVLD